MTKLGAKRIHLVRGRGGNTKYRALRLETGNFSWGSEGVAKKTRIVGVVYNASNNELVRTNTLVKNSIVEIDATPFREFYEKHYRLTVPKKGETEGTVIGAAEGKKESAHVTEKYEARRKERSVDPKIIEQMQSGRVMACISSRPGQSGRADGYLLEGPELEFYSRKLSAKKGHAKAGK